MIMISINIFCIIMINLLRDTFVSSNSNWYLIYEYIHPHPIQNLDISTTSLTLPMKTSPKIHQGPMGRSSPMKPEMH